MNKIYLDEQGYQEYLKEIDAIKEKIRKNSSDITEYQSDDAYGDGWHDNFAYEQAIKKENSLFHELDIKLKGLNKIELIKRKKIQKNIVDLNCTVDIIFDGEDKKEKFIITGSTSSMIGEDISKITLNSPLGKAIYGKGVNDTFSYSVDNMTINGKIIDIRN